MTTSYRGLALRALDVSSERFLFLTSHVVVVVVVTAKNSYDRITWEFLVLEVSAPAAAFRKDS